MRLYRPVGLLELALIYHNDLRAFPPRLPEQPIFYPVLHVDYARQIAAQWNTRQSMFVGYVTQFDVADGYVARFEPHTVGARHHQELWVPAEELAEFNRHIVGNIAVVDAYFGAEFRGYVADRNNMQDKDAVQQFMVLEHLWQYNAAMDFPLEILANRKAVYLHFPYWMQNDFTEHGIATEWRQQLLRYVNTAWTDHFPEIKLCYADRH